jgi:hypothetical protein
VSAFALPKLPHLAGPTRSSSNTYPAQEHQYRLLVDMYLTSTLIAAWSVRSNSRIFPLLASLRCCFECKIVTFTITGVCLKHIWNVNSVGIWGKTVLLSGYWPTRRNLSPTVQLNCFGTDIFVRCRTFRSILPNACVSVIIVALLRKNAVYNHIKVCSTPLECYSYSIIRQLGQLTNWPPII